jgi:hypothetical protein
MDFDSGSFRTPLRPIQQQMYPHVAKDRLKDSPMDFSYDTPQREDANISASSSWLNNEEDRKRPREAIDDRGQVFAFGAKEPNLNSSGAFLFHQPLSPTIAGPDIEMSSETTPKRDKSETLKTNEEADGEGSQARSIATGALTRVLRNRAAGEKRWAAVSAEQSTRKPRSTSQTRNRNRARRKGRPQDQTEAWEDEEDEKPVSSLGRKVGDTMNIQYVFGGNTESHSRKPQHASWLDPEWCLGMAQFAFNSTLLLGFLWLIFGIVRTLQRDVADKVREYELGE